MQKKRQRNIKKETKLLTMLTQKINDQIDKTQQYIKCTPSAERNNLDIFIISVWFSCYVRGAFNRFPDIFCTGISNCRRLLKIQYLIAIHRMRSVTNFYDFTFKWTATAAIGIHPTKAWLSQLVNFKKAIWTWGHCRRTICNKILF